VNVFIDGQPLLKLKNGISRYTSCIYEQLRNDPEISVYLAFNKLLQSIKPNVLHITDVNNAQIINQRYPYRVIRRLTNPSFIYDYPYDLFHKVKADIFHGTNFTYNKVSKGKSIVNIHDLAFLKFPETTSERIYKHHSKWVPYSAARADHIIAISEQTKRDIVEILNVPDSKVTVIPLAADEHFVPLGETVYKPVLEKYQLHDPYILFVGTLEPRKNLLGLLKSYLLLKQNSNLVHKLVIVGAKGWKYSPVFDFVTEHGLEDDVIFLGFVSDMDLPSIYNGATLFVMPSIYEGFGMPIVEAMSCGIPVIGSNVSSIPEIIDRYGKLVSPMDHESWANEMHEIINDYVQHTHYSALALERSSTYSWKQNAIETKQLYIKVLNNA
jgi:glycosyltransferase involved in cell wall biosynthesis